jgi:hypothetical protein
MAKHTSRESSFQEREFLRVFTEAFACLRTHGMSRRRVRCSSHEYELWYYNQQYAVRITLERQWNYQYVFVIFSKRGESNTWTPLIYLDKWLKEHGWKQEEIESVLQADQPIPNLPKDEQAAFLYRVAEVVCNSVVQILA